VVPTPLRGLRFGRGCVLVGQHCEHARPHAVPSLRPRRSRPGVACRHDAQRGVQPSPWPPRRGRRALRDGGPYRGGSSADSGLYGGARPPTSVVLRHPLAAGLPRSDGRHTTISPDGQAQNDPAPRARAHLPNVAQGGGHVGRVGDPGRRPRDGVLIAPALPGVPVQHRRRDVRAKPHRRLAKTERAEDLLAQEPIQARLRTRPDTSDPTPGGSLFDRRRRVSIQAAPTGPRPPLALEGAEALRISLRFRSLRRSPERSAPLYTGDSGPYGTGSKTVVGGFVHRGFESHSLRFRAGNA